MTFTTLSAMLVLPQPLDVQGPPVISQGQLTAAPAPASQQQPLASAHDSLQVCNCNKSTRPHMPIASDTHQQDGA